jgi:hypothetical protein
MEHTALLLEAEDLGSLKAIPAGLAVSAAEKLLEVERLGSLKA